MELDCAVQRLGNMLIELRHLFLNKSSLGDQRAVASQHEGPK